MKFGTKIIKINWKIILFSSLILNFFIVSESETKYVTVLEGDPPGDKMKNWKEDIFWFERFEDWNAQVSFTYKKIKWIRWKSENCWKEILEGWWLLVLYRGTWTDIISGRGSSERQWQSTRRHIQPRSYIRIASAWRAHAREIDNSSACRHSAMY